TAAKASANTCRCLSRRARRPARAKVVSDTAEATMAATIAGAHQLVLELVASAAVVAAAKIRAITLPLLLSLAHRHLRRAVRLFGPEPLARLAAPSLTEQMGLDV